MAVFIKKVNIPQKSDLINIDMTGSGTAQTYRVIKNVGGSVVEVVSIFDVISSMSFGTNTSLYEHSTLDNYINSTWYNTLSNTAKLAIVDKTFKQDSWFVNTYGNPKYTGINQAGTSYTMGRDSAGYGNDLIRHCYALSIQDIIDYLGVTTEMIATDTTLTAPNIWQMIWNASSQQEIDVWTRSSCANSSGNAVYISKTGRLSYNIVSVGLGVRPAFQIDLSKIDYTFTDGRSLVELKPLSILQKSNNALSRVGMSYKVPIIYPTKSDIVDIDMTGSGTAQRFRVIKANDNIVEVVALAYASDSQQFASSGQTYENSALDTYLNTTWYGTLSNTAKLAIVDKTFRQDSWYWSAEGNPDYNGYYGTIKPGTNAYTISLANASFGNEITRHIYALSVQDVLDYVLDTNITDGLLQNYNIWKMFWNDEVKHPNNNNKIWLCSSDATTTSSAWHVHGNSGYLYCYGSDNTYAVRPAFQIDLSKIDFTIE